MSLLSLLRTLQSSLLLGGEQRPKQEQGHDLHEEQQHMQEVDVAGHKNCKEVKAQTQDMSYDDCDMDITDDSYYSHQGFSTSSFSRTSSPPPPISSFPLCSFSLPPAALHLLQRRIDIAIRYLLRYFSLSDLDCILQTPLDSTDVQDYDELFSPNLRVEDFADSDMLRIAATTIDDGRILGPLSQCNITIKVGPGSTADTSETAGTVDVGLVQWLCQDHFRKHCMEEAREKLKGVIYKNNGHCVEHERSAEIHFKTRERAQEFYALVKQYRCIVKLKIHLGWKDLDENDLWELAEVLTVGNVGDATLDCCCEGEEEVGEEEDEEEEVLRTISILQQHQRIMQQQPTTSISFKPLLGLMFSPSLVSFTLENLSGIMPALSASSFTSSVDGTFSLQAYREATEIVLPTSNSLRVLTISRCGPEARAHRLLELFHHSPNLNEIQIDCELIDTALPMISEFTNDYDKITFLRLTESPWENADLYFGKPTVKNPNIPALQTFIQAINRKTLRPPSLNLRVCGVMENVTTCCFLNLWEKHQVTLSTLLANNLGAVSMEFMCETPYIDRLWRFVIAHYQYHQHVLHEKKQSASGVEPQHPTLTFPPIPPEELAALDSSTIRTLKAE
ncbi:hypothetical protein BGZ65_003174, partial [Modicella reniformis]